MMKREAVWILSVRLSEELGAALEAFAEQERRKVADAYRLILEDRLRDEGLYGQGKRRK
jgi:hypothetical protein